MGNFDDLPDPEAMQRMAGARESDASREARFVRELEPLFLEMATKLQDHGTTSVRRLPLGDCNPGNELYRSEAYLLSDGSVYPSIEAGMVALLGYQWSRLGTDDDPWNVAEARRRLIEGLKKRYTEFYSVRRQ